MEDIITGIVLVVVALAIIIYLIRASKRGSKCIGCPYAKKCKTKNCCPQNENSEKGQ